MSFVTVTSCCSASTSKRRLLAFAAGLILGMKGPSSALANIEGRKWVFHQSSQARSFEWSACQSGSPSIRLMDLVTAYSLHARYDPDHFVVRLENPNRSNSIELRTYSREIKGNLRSGSNKNTFEIQLSNTPCFDEAQLLVPLDFGDRALRPLLSGLPPSRPLSMKPEEPLEIVIDPGHGGNDFGASVLVQGVKLHEKDLVLAFAHELKKQLSNRGRHVGLTREDDSFLTLNERAEFANQNQAQLFISLHLNSEPSGKGAGFEIYVPSLGRVDQITQKSLERENAASSPREASALLHLRAESLMERALVMAKGIAKALADESPHRKRHSQNAPSNPRMHSIRSGPFHVLLEAKMPALLIELGFLTHAADRERLLSEPTRRQIASRLAQTLADPFLPSESRLKDQPRRE